MNRRHTYEIRVAWTGNLGKGSSSYKGYSRDYDIVCKGKPVIKGSAATWVTRLPRSACTRGPVPCVSSPGL